MGTKTQTEGYIETILHENEHGNGSNGYSTTELPVDEPTPITTAAEEVGRADEFPAVIQAGMWVRTTQDYELIKDHRNVNAIGIADIEIGSVGQVVEDRDYEGVIVKFDDNETESAVASVIETNLQSGDPLPDFLEQVNAPEPATLPDSTPLDALSTEDLAAIARRLEDGQMVEYGVTDTTPAEASKRYVPRDVLETLGDIYDLSAEAQRISFKLDGAKAVVKELREELDVANSKLRSAALALKWSREPEPELFRQQRNTNTTTVDDTFYSAETQVSQSTPATPDESWRSISIDVLALPGKIPEQLKAWSPSLDTIGAIADFTSKPFNKLTDVKGIGPGKATTIEDALMRFWRDHPEFCGPDSGVLLASNKENAPDQSSTDQGSGAFDSGMTLDDNPHPRGSSDWDEWRAGFKERAGIGDEDEAVGDEDL